MVSAADCQHGQRCTSTPENILQRLDCQVIRPLDGILQGDYRTLFYGFGLDLADVREYQEGDDVRLECHRVAMEDAESGEQLLVNTGDRKFRQRFVQAALRRERELDRIFRQAHVDTFQLSTEDDLFQAIVRFVDERRNRASSRNGPTA